MRRPPSVEAPRRVSLLGATGSVGTSTVALLRERPGLYQVEAVAGGRNAARLAEVAIGLGARFAAIADPAAFPALKGALSGTGIEAAAGADAVVEAAARPAEWVLAAIVGAAGLEPTLAAIRRGAMIGLANKECLICAGELMIAAVEAHGATLLPVDSEHNAIFQALGTASPSTIERLILTASGGPFRTWPRERMAGVTPAEAVRHPNWSMGAKISVDSATMMNKGLEIIEASYLFGVPEERIEVLVHPQSVVHSLVAFPDGSQVAQLGAPDMRIPIAHTLAWPGRLATAAPRLDLAAVARLDFEPPDALRFPALGLARLALRAGGAAPTILNAANEIGVGAFLAGRIGFLDIVRIVADTLDRLSLPQPSDLGSVLACDREARRLAAELIADVADPATRSELVKTP